MDIYNIDFYINTKKETILIVFLINSFILVDLHRNEIKKIISYYDILDLVLIEDGIKIIFNRIICRVKFFLIFRKMKFLLNFTKIINLVSLYMRRFQSQFIILMICRFLYRLLI